MKMVKRVGCIVIGALSIGCVEWLMLWAVCDYALGVRFKSYNEVAIFGLMSVMIWAVMIYAGIEIIRESRQFKEVK